MSELNTVPSSFTSVQQFILTMASQVESDSDWIKKHQQAQPFINRIRSVSEKKTWGFEQIGFLRRCQKERLTPKGLRVKLPTNMEKTCTDFGGRLQGRSEKRVLKRTIGDLFVNIYKEIGQGTCGFEVGFE